MAGQTRCMGTPCLPGISISNATCEACSGGKYQDERGQYSQRQWLCAGQVLSLVGNTSLWVSRLLWLASTKGMGQTSCNGNACVAGKFGRFIPAECQKCSEGKFQDQAGQNHCELCVAGQHLPKGNDMRYRVQAGKFFMAGQRSL